MLIQNQSNRNTPPTNRSQNLTDLSRLTSGPAWTPQVKPAGIFAALWGAEEAIPAGKRVPVSRAILSDCAREQVDRKRKQLRERDVAAITYFQVEGVAEGRELGYYVTETGVVTELDPTGAILRLGERWIPFADIVDLQWENT